MAHDTLGLQQNETQIATHLAQLGRDILALENTQRRLLSGTAPALGGEVSYEVLRMNEEYARSVAVLAKARADREVADKAIAANESSASRYEKLVRSIRESPYLKAVDGNVAVAFVPYDNVRGVRGGAPLYGCRLGILWCRPIGKVVDVLDGEVLGRHPLYNRPERGLMVQMELADAHWAKERVLFIGRAPIFI